MRYYHASKFGIWNMKIGKAAIIFLVAMMRLNELIQESYKRGFQNNDE